MSDGKSPSDQDIAATFNGHEPAAPFSRTDGRGAVEVYLGLTKREAFSLAAMQGLCASAIPGPHHYFPTLATEAVAYADALLKELAK